MLLKNKKKLQLKMPRTQVYKDDTNSQAKPRSPVRSKSPARQRSPVRKVVHKLNKTPVLVLSKISMIYDSDADEVDDINYEYETVAVVPNDFVAMVKIAEEVFGEKAQQKLLDNKTNIMNADDLFDLLPADKKRSEKNGITFVNKNVSLPEKYENHASIVLAYDDENAEYTRTIYFIEKVYFYTL